MSEIVLHKQKTLDELSSALNCLNSYEKYSRKYPELTAKSAYFHCLVKRAKEQLESAHDTLLLKALEE